MSPASRAAVAIVLILVAVWVARLLVSLEIVPWIAALVAPLLVALAALAGISLRRRRG